MTKQYKGFTLIELLIVVAIIAILAAIAVPNFLEAQTRAKVSRVQADLRSMVTAIETYRIDHGKAPADYNYPTYDKPKPMPGSDLSQVTGILHPGYRDVGGRPKVGLSTPVSYISNPWIQDPFVGKSGGNIEFEQQVYSYNPIVKLWDRPDPTHYSNRPGYRDYYGEYRLGSIGPDRSWYNVVGAEREESKPFSTYRHSMPYDPSNGTLSVGNIWRSQKHPVVSDRPLADRNLP